jgi:competence protein ComFC
MCVMPALRPREILETLRDLFFPAHCAGCAVAVKEGWFCPDCAAQIRPVPRPFCEICSQPYAGTMDRFVCVNCRGRAFHFECAVAVMHSRGVMRDLIHRLKYGRELWLEEVLGGFLEQGFSDPRLAGVEIDLIIPVPLHALRKREREFNQAEVLASALARRRQLPFSDALIRLRHTVTQTHFDRRRRMQNLRDAFELRQNVPVQGKHLLLVDDVLTTGSTLDECARVLLEAGAESVRGLTVARG